jgi:hypothetical protein
MPAFRRISTGPPSRFTNLYSFCSMQGASSSERQFCTTPYDVGEIFAVLGCNIALIGIYRRFGTTYIFQLQGSGCSYDSNFLSSAPWCGPYRASVLLKCPDFDSDRRC